MRVIQRILAADPSLAAVPGGGADAIPAARDALARADKRIGAGPGRLGRAFAITPLLDSTDLCDETGPLYLADDGTPVPDEAEIVTTTRIGITKGADLPWRFYLRASRWVSRR